MPKTTEEYIIETSGKILDLLLDHKKMHPEFTFWLRRRDMEVADENRLKKGYWFQGSHYIWVSFYQPADKKSRTKTIGFSINAKDPANIENSFGWVFNDVEDRHRRLYERLHELFPDAQRIQDSRYKLVYKESDVIKNLDYFLNVQKPKIDGLIKELGLEEDYFVPEEFFQIGLSKVLRYRDELNNATIMPNTLKSVPFFVEEDLTQIKKFTGQRSDRANPSHEQTYTYLKATYDKVEYWARAVLGRAFPDGEMNILKKPTNQANNFQSFLWASLYPSEKLKEWKSLAYTLTFSTPEGFCVKIDTVNLPEGNATRKSYLKYRGEFSDSSIVKLFKTDDILPTNWETLISKSIHAIKSLEADYAKLLSMMGYEGGYHMEVGSPSYKTPLNVILFGPPGTGKTYSTINHALAVIERKPIKVINGLDRDELRLKFESYKSQGQVETVTFHQSMSYEDFIEGIKPISQDVEIGTLEYRVIPGIFKQMVDRAKFQEQDNFDTAYDNFVNDVGEESIELRTLRHNKPFNVTINSSDNCTVRPMTEAGTRMVVTKEMISQYLRTGKIKDWKPYLTSIAEYLKKRYDFKSLKSTNDPAKKNFVLIIDEINRGNIAQIFGELITLIEEDKRIGAPEQVEVTLPYSKEKFGVPSNLFIIGTMNTADRSVEALDTALRRRFSFVEMPPLYDRDELEGEWFGVALSDLLRTINNRLEKLLSKDHLIGHSYFLAIDSTDNLKAAFQNKLIPLLQEYFYGDFGKIGLVLGEGFLEKSDESSTDQNLFAEFANYEVTDLLERPIYRLKDVSMMSDSEFETALQLLMRRIK